MFAIPLSIIRIKMAMAFCLVLLLAFALRVDCDAFSGEGKWCGGDDNFWGGCDAGLYCKAEPGWDNGFGFCTKTESTINSTANPPESKSTTQAENTTSFYETTTWMKTDDCPDNEYWSNCSLCPEWNCKDVKEVGERSGPTEKCGEGNQTGNKCTHRVGCYCQHGYARNDKGRCVLEKQCHLPDCGLDAHYEEKPTCLDNGCEDIAADGKRDNYTIIFSDKEVPTHPARRYHLKPGCRCDEGFVRNIRHECVSVEGFGCMLK